jgi:hypothetical protein
MPPEPTNLCIDIQPQLAAYALGEAEADAELLDHLAMCPACQRDLRAYVQVARMLPYDAPDVAPPPALRARLLAAVEDSAGQTAAAPPTPIASTPIAPESIAPAPPSPALPRRRWRWPAFRPALALALSLIIALLGWNIALQRQLGEQAAQIGANRASWQTMIGLLNDPAVRWYAVAGDSSHGHFWAAPGGQVACLVIQGLPPLAADRVYQVWLRHGNERISGGVFEARNGNGWVLVRSSEALDNYDSVGITVEPRGGSDAPTGPPVLQGALAAAVAPTAIEKQQLLGLLAIGSP